MQEAFLYNVLSLAYLGDSVYELKVREKLVTEHRLPAGELHKLAQAYVSAAAQSHACDKLLEIMNENESSIFNRAKNSSPANIPKHSSRAEYHRATALEAVFGYNHLSGNSERNNEIFEQLFIYLNQ